MTWIVASSITLLAFLSIGTHGLEISKSDLENVCSTLSQLLANGTQQNEAAALIRAQYLEPELGLLQRVPSEKSKKGEKGAEGEKGYYDDDSYYSSSGDSYYGKPSSNDDYYYSKPNYYSGSSYYAKPNSNHDDDYYYSSSGDSYYGKPSSNDDYYYSKPNYYSGSSYYAKPHNYYNDDYPSKDQYYTSSSSYGDNYPPSSGYGHYGRSGDAKVDDEKTDRLPERPSTEKQAARPVGPTKAVPKRNTAQVPPRGSQQAKLTRGSGPRRTLPDIHRSQNTENLSEFFDQLVDTIINPAGEGQAGQLDCSQLKFPDSINSEDQDAFEKLRALLKPTETN